MPRATTLSEAIDFLEWDPLDEAHEDWYVENELIAASGRKLHPLAELQAHILRARGDDRLFLSGHVGSGKSTELARILRKPEVLAKFFVVRFTLRKTEIPSLTSHQLLFIIAAELYAQGKAAGLLGKKAKKWQSILERIGEGLFGATGVTANQGKVALEFDLIFLKLRQELELQESWRVKLGSFAQADGTILVDLINGLSEDIQTALDLHGQTSLRLLIATDDLDKVRDPKVVEDIFKDNLGTLRSPKVPIVMTIPASVTFGGTSNALGKNVYHLRPVQVLKKTDETDPLAACDPSALPYMRAVLSARVADGLFTPEVIDKAAAYSGGVLREFFRLLRESAIRAADLYALTSVDAITFEDTVIETRNALDRNLYPADREALKAIRAAHSLVSEQQLSYMNVSLVLEYNHTGIWWEVNPLLWERLK